MKKNEIFFRRCHACGHVTEMKGAAVQRCTHCQKPLVRFLYFDERLMPIYVDHQERPRYAPGEIYALQGLSAYWDD